MTASSPRPPSAGGAGPAAVPILLYHSVSSDPPGPVRDFAVTPAVFADHLDLLADEGCTALTVADYLGALDAPVPSLPPRPVVVTFDDGWADFRAAADTLAGRGLPATLYVTTGLLGGRPGAGTVLGDGGCHGLAWTDLVHIASAGIEIGGHSHSHPQLDTLSIHRARDEILRSKNLLEDELQKPIETFAYPHGYSTRAVRAEVRHAGFVGACGVKNALSSDVDDRWSLARLTVRPTTSTADVRAWLGGSGAPSTPPTERARTRAWRAYRRGRAVMRTGVDARKERAR